jgi:hypothetical protein
LANVVSGAEMTDQKKQEMEVWEFVQALNRTWTVENNADGLREFFHEDMVAFTSDERERLEGRQACIDSWKDYTMKHRIHHWEEIDPRIQLFCNGEAAVVTYYYNITVSRGGQKLHSSAREMLFLVRENGHWWVVADQFSGYTE